MTIVEYKKKVIELFRDGNPSIEQWEQMSQCVLHASEGEYTCTDDIDEFCDPEGWEEGFYNFEEN